MTLPFVVSDGSKLCCHRQTTLWKVFLPSATDTRSNICIHFQSPKLVCLQMNISLENLNYGRKSYYHISSWKEFSVWYPSGDGQVPYSPRSNFLLFLSGDGLRPKVEGMFLCGVPSNRHSSHCRRKHCRMRHLDALWNRTHLCTSGFYSWVSFCMENSCQYGYVIPLCFPGLHQGHDKRVARGLGIGWPSPREGYLCF